MTAPAIPPCVEHYALTGCTDGHSNLGCCLETFMLSSEVHRGTLARLRRLWADIGPRVKARMRGATFTESVLAGRIPRPDPANPTIVTWAPFGILHCDEHAPRAAHNPPPGDT